MDSFQWLYDIKDRETYQSIKKTKHDITITTDHTATTIVCSLLFRGILIGTKLDMTGKIEHISQ